jgi:hypothetical protein
MKITSTGSAVDILKHGYEIYSHHKNVREIIDYTKKPTWQTSSQFLRETIKKGSGSRQ